MSEALSNEQMGDVLYDSVPVPDGNQFAGTGVGQPGYNQQEAPDAQTTQAEAKAADTPKEPEAGKTEAKVEGAPEKYSFKDADRYDAKVLANFAEAAKELNLSQDAAQGLLSRVAPVMAQRQAEQIAAMKESWVNESRNDQILSKGGDERVFLQNLAVAKRGFDAVANSDVRSIMDQSGLGNHPAVLKMFLKIGQTISEDSFVGGKASPQQARSMADVLYDRRPSE